MYNRSFMYDYLTCLQIHYDDINTNRYLHLENSLFHLGSTFCLKVKRDMAMPCFVFNLLIASQLL